MFPEGISRTHPNPTPDSTPTSTANQALGVALEVIQTIQPLPQAAPLPPDPVHSHLLSLDACFHTAQGAPSAIKATTIPVDDAEYRTLFVSVHKDSPALPTEIGEKYPEQNRYPDIFSHDHWLFRLNDPKGKLTPEAWKEKMLRHTRFPAPYINASRMGSHQGDILTQGPLMFTMDEFWTMVWKAKTPLIVMLTDFQEGEREKCTPYFPKKIGTSKMFSDAVASEKYLQVSLEAHEENRRTFVINREDKSRTVTHFHYADWPDQEPCDPHSLKEIIVRTAECAQGRPIIVHCSAGVGRAGTFYACYLIYLAWLQNRGILEVNVPQLIHTLRNFRTGLIANSAQLKTIFQFIEILNLSD